MLNEFIPAYRAQGPAVTEVSGDYEPRHRLEPTRAFIFQEAVNFLLEQLRSTEAEQMHGNLTKELRTNSATSTSLDNGAPRAFSTAGILVKECYGNDVAINAVKEVFT